ncbi:MAG: ubiquitin-like domain-containing protein, partial [Terriglobia bacterium]
LSLRQFSLGFLILGLLTTVFISSTLSKQVHLIVDGDRRNLSTHDSSVRAFLEHAGVKITEADYVRPSLNSKIGDGMTVRVRKARLITMELNGTRFEVNTPARTVGELLRELEVDTDGHDKVVPKPDTVLVANSHVRIEKASETLEIVKKEIPFQTVKEEHPGLAAGSTEIVRSGKSGLLVQVFGITNGANGESRTLRWERPVLQPETRIVRVGTKIDPPQLARAQPRGAPRGPAQPAVSRGAGRVMRMNATAYAPGFGAGTITATGRHAGFGLVAVDPRVIPLGTRLYIDGYGPALAADTGGAIKGNRIDLGYDSGREAINFGRQPVTVEILP